MAGCATGRRPMLNDFASGASPWQVIKDRRESIFKLNLVPKTTTLKLRYEFAFSTSPAIAFAEDGSRCAGIEGRRIQGSG
jgi:hypothetical protein